MFVMVELKVVRRGKKVKLSPHQIAFHLKHADLGCPTFVLVQYFPARLAKPELLLYQGGRVEEVFWQGVEAEPAKRWTLPGVDWEEMRECLAGGI